MWLGEGNTPQGARHDAAARALRELRPAPPVAPAPPVPEVLHSAATDHATANGMAFDKFGSFVRISMDSMVTLNYSLLVLLHSI